MAPFPLMPRAICARPLTLLLSSAEGGHDSADDDEDGTRSKEDERDNLGSVFNGQSETIMNGWLSLFPREFTVTFLNEAGLTTCGRGFHGQRPCQVGFETLQCGIRER